MRILRILRNTSNPVRFTDFRLFFRLVVLVHGHHAVWRSPSRRRSHSRVPTTFVLRYTLTKGRRVLSLAGSILISPSFSTSMSRSAEPDRAAAGVQPAVQLGEAVRLRWIEVLGRVRLQPPPIVVERDLPVVSDALQELVERVR